MTLLDDLNLALPPPVEEESLLDKLNRVAPKDSTMASRTAGVADAALSMASAAANTLVGGLAGAVATPLFGAETGANVVNSFTNTIRKPQTTEGQQNLESVGADMQSIIDELNIPLANIGFFIEILTNQGLDQAIDTFSRIPKEGAGVVAGDRVLEETGSPLLATGARILPEAIVEIGGLKGGASVLKSGVDNAAKATDFLTSSVKNTATDVFEYQSPTKKKIGDLIKEGSESSDTAGFKIEDPSPLRQFFGAQTPRVVRDPLQINAQRQGFDDGVISVVTQASPADKGKMLQMLDTLETSRKNKRYALENRPSDVAGNSLLDRFRVVRAANRSAGKKLDGEAAALKGKPIDSGEVFAQFDQSIDSIGVRTNPDGTPNFEGSIIEGLDGPEKAIKRILLRINKNPAPDAFELHRIKKFIDEQVTFGKTAEGLGGKTEIILKELRHNIDTLLDDTFPSYNKVNTDYSETISAIDALQDAAGKKLDLTGENADKAVGTLLRRLMSNAQSRINLLDSVKEINSVSGKHGGKFDDDILTQILFADELDAVFGPVARTSLQGEVAKIAKSVPTSTGDAAVKTAEAIEGAVRGKTPEQAIKAIRALLNSNN